MTPPSAAEAAPRTALVVGGNGFMGAHVVRALATGGWRVRVLDLRERPLLEPPPAFELVTGDYGDEAILDRALEGVDAVVHAAGVALPSAGLREPLRDVEGELARSLRLAACCAERGVGRIVFASSGGTVYGETPLERVSEDHTPAPVTSYAVMKLATEHYLRVFRRLHGLDSVVLRIGNPYGPGQSPDGRQGFVAVLLGSLLSGRPFELWGDGSVVRDFVYVEDVARAFLAALRVGAHAPRLYNVGTGRGLSLRAMVAAVHRVTGIAPPVAYRPGRPIDIPRNVLDCSRAARHLGWAATTSLDEGLRSTWAWVTATVPPARVSLDKAAPALADR